MSATEPSPPVDRVISWFSAALIQALRSPLMQRLPKKAAAAAPLGPPPSALERHRRDMEWVASQPLYCFAGLTAERPILITDDEVGLLRLYRLLFERNGLTVITTPSGREAFEISQSRPVSLMITDLMKPEVSGYELIEWVRSRARTRTLPVLIVSARSLSTADQSELDEWTWYLCKPIFPPVLLEKVGFCLGACDQS